MVRLMLRSNGKQMEFNGKRVCLQPQVLNGHIGPKNVEVLICVGLGGGSRWKRQGQ